MHGAPPCRNATKGSVRARLAVAEESRPQMPPQDSAYSDWRGTPFRPSRDVSAAAASVTTIRLTHWPRKPRAPTPVGDDVSTVRETAVQKIRARVVATALAADTDGEDDGHCFDHLHRGCQKRGEDQEDGTRCEY